MNKNIESIKSEDLSDAYSCELQKDNSSNTVVPTMQLDNNLEKLDSKYNNINE